ncbi:MAG: hypothetical protein M3044_01710 [Thermoproteota archaeon]|nr:hypothetical protein [Thermoproteota archaeon]
MRGTYYDQKVSYKVYFLLMTMQTKFTLIIPMIVAAILIAQTLVVPAVSALAQLRFGCGTSVCVLMDPRGGVNVHTPKADVNIGGPLLMRR